MIVEFADNGLGLAVAVVAPGDQAIAIGAHAVTHQVVLEEVAVPGIALLLDDAALDVLDQGAEEGLAHARRERIGGPFPQRRIWELTEGC